MKFSRNFTCSVIGLCVKWPPVVTSRHRSACMSIPKQKSRSNMLSGKDMSGMACINAKNLAQDAPIDSFLYCSKSNVAFGREPIRDMGKMQDKTCLYVYPSQHSYFLRQVCTIASPSLWEKRETISTLEFLVSCLRCSGTNTCPQTCAGGGRGFHFLAQEGLCPNHGF